MGHRELERELPAESQSERNGQVRERAGAQYVGKALQSEPWPEAETSEWNPSIREELVVRISTPC